MALILFAAAINSLSGSVVQVGWLHGLKVVAVAVVAQAIWTMDKRLCPERTRASLAIAAAIPATAWPGTAGQLTAILAGALGGLRWLSDDQPARTGKPVTTLDKNTTLVSLSLFFILLLTLPLLADQSHGFALFDSFYRSGALVFGGGHIVPPLLQSEIVGHGWLSKDVFLAGYGAAQAVPRPLFTFAAFLGSSIQNPDGGWTSGILC